MEERAQTSLLMSDTAIGPLANLAGEIAGDHERHMLAVLEFAFDAFVEVDAAGIVTGWNSRAEKAYGRRRAEVIGRPAQVMVPDRHRENFDTLLTSFVSSDAAPPA